MIRPDICLPVVSSLRDAIAEEVKTYAALPVQAVEWRVWIFLPDMRKKYRRL